MFEPLHALEYHHVDVFTRKPLSGNGLIVFPDAGALTTATMQRVTQEMRQFESIFLAATPEPYRVRARVFHREDPRPHAMWLWRGGEKNRLELAHLLGDALHRRRGERARVWEDDQPIARQRLAGEDIHVMIFQCV